MSSGVSRGEELERLNAVVDFELFRADLERAVPHSDRASPDISRGGAEVGFSVVSR